MFVNSTINRELLSLNVSTRELSKLEEMDVKQIKQIDFNRLKQTLSSTENQVKQSRILKILNEGGQYNENGIHMLSKYSPSSIIYLHRNRILSQGVTGK